MKKTFFLILMGTCGLKLCAQRLSLASATVSAINSTEVKDVAQNKEVKAIYFTYDDAGNCIQWSNALKVGKCIDLERSLCGEEVLTQDNFATVILSSNNNVVVSLTSSMQNEGQVSICSLAGVVINVVDIKSAETILCIQDQPTGVYIVNVKTACINKSFKIFKP